jgi:hypothetical protein
LCLGVERGPGDRLAASPGFVVEGEVEVVDTARARVEGCVDQCAENPCGAGVHRERILGAIAGHYRLLASSRMLVFGVQRTDARAEPALVGEFFRQHAGNLLCEFGVLLGAPLGGKRMSFDRAVEQDTIRGHAPFAIADDFDRAYWPARQRRRLKLGGRCAWQDRLTPHPEFSDGSVDPFGPIGLAGGRQFDWN